MAMIMMMIMIMAMLMIMMAMMMIMAEAPVDNVLCTDLEASRVLVVENQRQQYVPSLKGHHSDFDDDRIDNNDHNFFNHHRHHHLTFNLFSKTKLTAAAERASWTGRTRRSEK